MPKSFTKDEVHVVLSILVRSLESLVEVKETRDLLVKAGTSEYYIEEVINQKQLQEFTKAGFAPGRFGMIRTIFRDYSDDEEIRTKLQKMCALEEMFVNLVIAHNQNGKPLDNIFNTEIQLKPGEFAHPGTLPQPQSKDPTSNAPKPLQME